MQCQARNQPAASEANLCLLSVLPGSPRQPLPPRPARLLPLTHQVCNKTQRQLVVKLLTPRADSGKAAAAVPRVQSH